MPVHQEGERVEGRARGERELTTHSGLSSSRPRPLSPSFTDRRPAGPGREREDQVGEEEGEVQGLEVVAEEVTEVGVEGVASGSHSRWPPGT